MHYVTIHRAEKGSTRITAPVVMALAKALHVSTDYLLGADADAPQTHSPQAVQDAPSPTEPRKLQRTRKVETVVKALA